MRLPFQKGEVNQVSYDSSLHHDTATEGNTDTSNEAGDD